MTLSTSALSALKKLAATREALVAENAIRAESLGAYRAAMRDVPYSEQIPFENWMAKQLSKEPGFAEGGSVGDETKPYFGGAGTRKYAEAKRRMELADVNTLPDPRTYAAVSGLLGTPPDEQGFSAMHPDSAAIRSVANPAFAIGSALQVAPMMGALTKFGKAIAEAPSITQGSRMGQRGVIKMKDGNWLTGSVEDALRGLKRPGANPEQMLELNPEYQAIGNRNNALNSWVDKQLTRYVKNELATPEDPVRALAERGVLHVDPAEFGSAFRPSPSVTRARAGQPPEGSAQSATAHAWEDAGDTSVLSSPASEHLFDETLEANPWLLKVPPETPVHRAKYTIRDDLGFNHLMDELRNATNPASGLPLDLQLKYSALNQVSVPQAVERVAKINEWRAAQKAEADLAKANNAATVLHKEYLENNPKGFKWVELKQPERPTLIQGEYKDPMFDIPLEQQERISQQAHQQARRIYPDDESDDYMMAVQDIQGQLSDAYAAKNKPIISKELQDALKYEGDTMGHCVGGYCPDVMEGRSRIYSLRDAKGQPHVTIEVEPSPNVIGHELDTIMKDLPHPQDPSKTLQDVVKERMRPGGNWNKIARMVAEEYGVDLEPARALSKITQIKGKGNKKPNDKYLPYVQDFVKSGKWSDVGDLQNTGLKRLSDMGDEPMIKAAREKLGNYATPEEWDAIMRGGQGFAHGGSVTADYDPSYLNHRVDRLRAELGL
jgi:PcfJ-like protein